MLSFEKFTESNAFRKKFFGFLNIKINDKKNIEISKILLRPHNVIIPKDFGLTTKQNVKFKKICGKILKN